MEYVRSERLLDETGGGAITVLCPCFALNQRLHIEHIIVHGLLIPSQQRAIMPDSTGTHIEASTVSRRKFLQGLVMAGAGGGAGLALGQILAPPVFAGGSTGDIDSASYIVYNKSGTINAVNGTTGSVDFSGTNATTVVQSTINALTNGSVYIKDGTGTLGTLTHKPGVTVIQETQGSFQFLNGSPAVKTKIGVPADSDFGTAVDGLLQNNTGNNQLYVRSSGSWRSIASLLFPGATIIYDVPSLQAALNVTTPPGGNYVILPGTYDLGSGQIVLGQNGAILPEMCILGLVPEHTTGAVIKSSINGSTFVVAGQPTGQRDTFLKDLFLENTSTTGNPVALEFQQGITGLLLDSIFLYTGSTPGGIGLKIGGGPTYGANLGNMLNVRSIADIALYVNSFFNRVQMVGCGFTGGFSSAGAGIRTVAGTGGSFGSKCVGCFIEGQFYGIGADLNAVSVGGNLTSDFSFTGCSFSNWGTADINVGNANLHAKLIGCETKNYGTFSIMGPGTVDVISCYETNTGNTTTRRYGNPAPSAIAVSASPFTFVNSVPAANGQYCALIIYWFGGTVSSVTVGGVQIANSSPGVAILQPGDSLVITYSAAPTMIQQPRLAG